MDCRFDDLVSVCRKGIFLSMTLQPRSTLKSTQSPSYPANTKSIFSLSSLFYIQRLIIIYTCPPIVTLTFCVISDRQLNY